MKILALVISGIMMMPAVYAGGGGGGKKKKDQPDNGREDYYKYEREDVTRLRDIYQFTMPEVVAPEQPGVIETVNAQSVAPFFLQGNKIYFDQDMRLDQYMQLHKNIWSDKHELPGWRIQVFTGSVRANAFRVKNNLMAIYPEMPSYMDYDLPNYKVRLGDFFDKETADLFCREVREEHYPGAFLVKETIPLPKFKPIDETINESQILPGRN